MLKYPLRSDFSFANVRRTVRSCDDCEIVLQTELFDNHPGCQDHAQNSQTLQGSIEVVLVTNQIANNEIAAQIVDQESELIHQSLRLLEEQHHTNRLRKYTKDESAIDFVDAADEAFRFFLAFGPGDHNPDARDQNQNAQRQPMDLRQINLHAEPDEKCATKKWHDHELAGKQQNQEAQRDEQNRDGWGHHRIGGTSAENM